MKANVYKIEMLVIDHERMSEEAVRFEFQDHDTYSKVMRLEKIEIDWGDSHPLNHRDTQEQAFRALFDGDKPEEAK